MKLLSIRLVLIIALALIVTVAVLSAGATALVLTHGTSAAQQRSTLIQMMLVNSRHWTEPAWQQATRARLATMNMTVIIHDSTGQVLYQSGTYDSFAPV